MGDTEGNTHWVRHEATDMDTGKPEVWDVEMTTEQLLDYNSGDLTNIHFRDLDSYTDDEDNLVRRKSAIPLPPDS